MTEEIVSAGLSQQSTLSDKNESLLVLGKGIWPLIIGIFILAIYMTVSVILLFVSYKFGRLQ